MEDSTTPAVDGSPGLGASDIITVCIYTVIGAVGIMGNALVLVIFSVLKSKKSQVNSFILNQALADFTTSFLLIMYGFSRIVRNQISHSGFFGEFLCRFWWSRFFVFSSFAVSTFNLTAMSVERFIAVVQPLKYPFIFTKRTTFVIILIVWAVAPCMQWIFPVGLYELNPETNMCQFQASWSFQVAGSVSGVLLFLWEYFIPVVFMLIAYVAILKTLKRKESQIQALTQKNTAGKPQPAQTSSAIPTRQSGIRFNVEASKPSEPNTSQQAAKPKTSSAQARRRNVTVTLFIMFLVYVICWTPNQFTFLQFNLGGPLDFNGVWYHVTVFMAFVNTCVNPFIYALKHKQFQKGLKQIFRCNGVKDDHSSQVTYTVSGTAVD